LRRGRATVAASWRFVSYASLLQVLIQAPIPPATRERAKGSPTVELNTIWRELFLKWPADVSKRGIVITSLNDQIPFEGFLVSERLLLLDRKTPDTMGARKVIIPFEQLAGVKLIDVVKGASFKSLEFQGTLSQG
jgi:hypothetical protein